jgi:hypothetical protein
LGLPPIDLSLLAEGGPERNEHLWLLGAQTRNHPAHARLGATKAVFRDKTVVDPLAGVTLLGWSVNILRQPAPD